MKKYLIVLMILAVALTASACSNSAETSTEPEAAAEPSTQLHTVPPSEAEQLEWAPVDCEITLDSSSAVYAESADFLTFALVGNTDEDCELCFTLDEKTAAMLKTQPADTAYYLTVNKKMLKGTVSFSEDFSELTMKGGYSYAEMCALATEIRGL
ncbi:MAG: hypothetical protein IJ639_00120 [Ruminococcus sp.]|nr:hypothetical protein [Ruminococcus sp.]